MEIRYAGALLLTTLWVWLFVLYLISRRFPSHVLFAVSCVVGLSGVVSWVVLDVPPGHPEAALPSLAAAAAGFAGALLTGIDCVREEGWRREPDRPAQTPDRSILRDLTRRIQSGQLALGACPRCGRHVCFRNDFTCPGCGARLPLE